MLFYLKRIKFFLIIFYSTIIFNLTTFIVGNLEIQSSKFNDISSSKFNDISSFDFLDNQCYIPDYENYDMEQYFNDYSDITLTSERTLKSASLTSQSSEMENPINNCPNVSTRNLGETILELFDNVPRNSNRILHDAAETVQNSDYNNNLCSKRKLLNSDIQNSDFNDKIDDICCIFNHFNAHLEPFEDRLKQKTNNNEKRLCLIQRFITKFVFGILQHMNYMDLFIKNIENMPLVDTYSNEILFPQLLKIFDNPEMFKTSLTSILYFYEEKYNLNHNDNNEIVNNFYNSFKPWIDDAKNLQSIIETEISDITNYEYLSTYGMQSKAKFSAEIALMTNFNIEQNYPENCENKEKFKERIFNMYQQIIAEYHIAKNLYDNISHRDDTIKPKIPTRKFWSENAFQTLYNEYCNDISTEDISTLELFTIFKKYETYYGSVLLDQIQNVHKKFRKTNPNSNGGQEVVIGQYNFTVTLKNKNKKSFCGGTLIMDQYILTAAHCVSGDEELSVSIGNYYSSSDDNTYDINKDNIYIHPGYNGGQSDSTVINDIAIVALSESVAHLNIQFPKLGIISDSFIEAGASVIMLGWGRNTAKGRMKTRMQQHNLIIEDGEFCKDKLADVFPNPDLNGTICTTGVFGSGVCFGDSGGPLILLDPVNPDAIPTLIGVVSYGVPCGVGKPDVFTKISDFQTWINGIVNPGRLLFVDDPWENESIDNYTDDLYQQLSKQEVVKAETVNRYGQKGIMYYLYVTGEYYKIKSFQAVKSWNDNTFADIRKVYLPVISDENSKVEEKKNNLLVVCNNNPEWIYLLSEGKRFKICKYLDKKVMCQSNSLPPQQTYIFNINCNHYVYGGILGEGARVLVGEGAYQNEYCDNCVIFNNKVYRDQSSGAYYRGEHKIISSQILKRNFKLMNDITNVNFTHLPLKKPYEKYQLPTNYRGQIRIGGSVYVIRNKVWVKICTNNDCKVPVQKGTFTIQVETMIKTNEKPFYDYSNFMQFLYPDMKNMSNSTTYQCEGETSGSYYRLFKKNDIPDYIKYKYAVNNEPTASFQTIDCTYMIESNCTVTSDEKIFTECKDQEIIEQHFKLTLGKNVIRANHPYKIEWSDGVISEIIYFFGNSLGLYSYPSKPFIANSYTYNDDKVGVIKFKDVPIWKGFQLKRNFKPNAKVYLTCLNKLNLNDNVHILMAHNGDIVKVCDQVNCLDMTYPENMNVFAIDCEGIPNYRYLSQYWYNNQDVFPEDGSTIKCSDDNQSFYYVSVSKGSSAEWSKYPYNGNNWNEKIVDCTWIMNGPTDCTPDSDNFNDCVLSNSSDKYSKSRTELQYQVINQYQVIKCNDDNKLYMYSNNQLFHTTDNQIYNTWDKNYLNAPIVNCNGIYKSNIILKKRKPNKLLKCTDFNDKFKYTMIRPDTNLLYTVCDTNLKCRIQIPKQNKIPNVDCSYYLYDGEYNPEYSSSKYYNENAPSLKNNDTFRCLNENSNTYYRMVKNENLHKVSFKKYKYLSETFLQSLDENYVNAPIIECDHYMDEGECDIDDNLSDFENCLVNKNQEMSKYHYTY